MPRRRTLPLVILFAVFLVANLFASRLNDIQGSFDSGARSSSALKKAPTSIYSQLSAILQDRLCIMSPASRIILKAVHQQNPAAATFTRVMWGAPINPGQCMDRYVDSVFHKLATSDWPAAETLINEYLVPKILILNHSKFRITPDYYLKWSKGITSFLRYKILTTIIKKSVSSANNPEEFLQLCFWDKFVSLTGLDIVLYYAIGAPLACFDALSQISQFWPNEKQVIQCYSFFTKVGSYRLWHSICQINLSKLISLYTVLGFCNLAHKIYVHFAKTSNEFEEYAEFFESLEVITLEAFNSLDTVAVLTTAPMARSSQLTTRLDTELMLQASDPFCMISLIGRLMLQGISFYNPDHEEFYCIMETNPMERWESIDTYLQFLLKKYHSRNQRSAIALAKEYVFEKSLILRASTKRIEIFENYLQMSHKVSAHFAKVSLSLGISKNRAQWECAKLCIHIDLGELEDETEAPHRLFEAILQHSDFKLTNDPEIRACGLFLCELGAENVWRVFKRKRVFIFNPSCLITLAKFAYVYIRGSDRKLAMSALARVFPSQKITFSEDFLSILAAHTKETSENAHIKNIY